MTDRRIFPEDSPTASDPSGAKVSAETALRLFSSKPVSLRVPPSFWKRCTLPVSSPTAMSSADDTASAVGLNETLCVWDAWSVSERRTRELLLRR